MGGMRYKSRARSAPLLLAKATVILLVTSACGCSAIRKVHRTGDLASDAQGLSGWTAFRTILRSTALATLKAPVTSSKVGGRVFYERAYSGVTGSVPATSMTMDGQKSGLPQPGSEAFETLLDAEGLPPRTSGSVRFFVDGHAFFPSFHRAIHGAKESIDLQAYIFDTDTFAAEVADALKRKSRQIPVRVYFDSLGSLLAARSTPPAPSPEPAFKSTKELVSYLKEDSNVQLRTTMNPYLMADHTKLHLIDRTTAFVGGMNVGAEYRYTWHDMMARISGPVVGDLARVYDDHWEGESCQRGWGLGGRPDLSDPPPAAQTAAPVPAGEAPLRLLLTDTLLSKREVLKAALAAIRCARKRVWIETPYISADQVVTELQNAVKRGVDVRVVIPATPDGKTMEKVNAEEMAKLLQTGARVYQYPGMTHLKATVCDDWMMFGSANYDTLSMRINRELNLATSHPATVRQLVEAVFEPDFRKSSQMTLEMAKAKGGVLSEVLGDQL